MPRTKLKCFFNGWKNEETNSSSLIDQKKKIDYSPRRSGELVTSTHLALFGLVINLLTSELIGEKELTQTLVVLLSGPGFIFYLPAYGKGICKISEWFDNSTE